MEDGSANKADEKESKEDEQILADSCSAPTTSYINKLNCSVVLV